jgi:two-component system sensor kinase ParS
MLSYARLDHPDIGMHWQSVPPGPWLERIAAKLDPDGDRIEVFMTDAPDEVRMDCGLMELALSNLLFNALRYAGTRVRCSVAKEADGYRLSVEDDGPGIPEQARQEVFRAFTRIDDSRSRDTGGSGLGLAIVARVAELHGGNAGVDESPDLKGARFSLRWPGQLALA